MIRTIPFNKDELMQCLKIVNDKYMYLLEAFKIPSQNSDNIVCSDFLLDDEPGTRLSSKVAEEDVAVEREARLKVMQNKISTKYLHRKRKQPTEGKTARKQLLKRKNVAKSLRKAKNIEQNQGLKFKETKKYTSDAQDFLKKSSDAATFNAMGKIVFSKIQLNENDVPRKGTETDAKKLLRKVLNEEREMKELRFSGETEKYAELKNQKAWERATKKTMGYKVKDDLGLLSKKIQKRKKQIVKSKQEWAQRKEKIEHTKVAKQKKRAENIKERVDKKKNKKKQKFAKKGRIVPGF